MNDENRIGWDHKRCIYLINMYRLKPELWNPVNDWYHNKAVKREAWDYIATKAGVSVDLAKAKLNSLLSSYRREKSRENKFIRAGKTYKSQWFAYKSFVFLRNRNKNRSLSDPISTSPLNEDAENVTVKTENIMEDPVVSSSESEDNTEELFADEEASNNFSVNTFDPNTTITSTYQEKTPEADPFPDNINVESLENCFRKDACDIYGEHVSTKLKMYSKRSQAVVQHLINNILFRADLGEYDNIKSRSDLNADETSTIHS